MSNRLIKFQEKFYAIRNDSEFFEIERNCESGQLQILSLTETRWRMPDELIAHLEWCIEQVRSLPPMEKTK